LSQEKKRQHHNKKIQSEHKFATVVQSVFRGFQGRKLAEIREREEDRIKSADSQRNACVTNIARVWRGYCGRIDAGYLRAEMAKFLFAIREEEVREEEQIVKSIIH
jgi:hypothetical protein